MLLARLLDQDFCQDCFSRSSPQVFSQVNWSRLMHFGVSGRCCVLWVKTSPLLVSDVCPCLSVSVSLQESEDGVGEGKELKAAVKAFTAGELWRRSLVRLA